MNDINCNCKTYKKKKYIKSPEDLGKFLKLTKELVENGYNFIAGINEERIVSLFTQLNATEFPKALNLYGNGNCAEQIVETILKLNAY